MCFFVSQVFLIVGKADANRLGPRLRDHLTDRFAGRWDMFSWFSLSTIATTYKGVRAPGERKVAAKTLADTLEALAILIADPALNRKRENLPSAAQAEQVKSPHPQTVRRYLEDILQKLEDGSPDIRKVPTGTEQIVRCVAWGSFGLPWRQIIRDLNQGA